MGEKNVEGFDEPIWAFTVALGEGGVPEPEPEMAAAPVLLGRWTFVSLALFAGLIVVLAFWLGLWTQALEPDVVVVRGETSVAMISFVNRSEDAAQNYFSGGIYEDINTDSTKVASLVVTPRATMHWFAGKALERGDIAREVAVRSILEGSVRRQEHRLRVSAQLYDPKADKQVWAERYERDIDDLLAVQGDISEKVVAAISAKLLAGALTRQVRTYTPNIEAYDLYIRGRAAGIPPTPSNIAKASELF